jgi:hypothetical protein
MEHGFKRGQKVQQTLPTGEVIYGRVVRLYTPKEIACHAKSHGPEAAARLPEWVVCKFTDRHGDFTLAHHYTSISAVAV